MTPSSVTPPSSRFSRSLVLLVIFSSLSAPGLAQAPLPAPPPPPSTSSCPSTPAACPPLAPPFGGDTGRSGRDAPSGLGDAFRTIGSDFAAFPSTKTLTWLGASAGVALVGTVGDRALVRNLDGGRWAGFRPGGDMGGAQAHAGLALGTFVAGRLSGSKEVTAFGFQLIRANIMAQALTHGMKVATHRIRPDGTGLSFPSGHTSTSFAAATVVHRRYGWKFGVPAYAVASYIAASRVNDRRHFATDVIFGAGLGIAVGMTVTRDLPGRGSLVPVVTRGGAAVTWSKTW